MGHRNHDNQDRDRDTRRHPTGNRLEIRSGRPEWSRREEFGREDRDEPNGGAGNGEGRSLEWAARERGFGSQGYPSDRGYGDEPRGEFDAPGAASWRPERERGPHTGRGPKGYTRSDQRIREDVCDQLTEHPHVDASDCEVKVERGEVTLSGTVDSRQAKRMAEDVADQVTGVVEVHNQLRLRGAVGAAASSATGPSRTRGAGRGGRR